MKETLREKYFRLRKEVDRMQMDLNKRQEEGIGPKNMTSGLSSVKALIRYKINEMKKMETQL